MRPTLAQNRERLANWLQYRMVGRVLLDAFAGSGILGLEALSRGAAWCDWVEYSPVAATALRQSVIGLGELATGRGEVHQADFMTFIAGAGRRYDGVFLDPPFAAGHFDAALEALVSADCLNEGAWVYLEMPTSVALPAFPEPLLLHRQSDKGQIRQFLLEAGSVESAQASR